MKRFFALVLAAVVALSLAACGSDSTTNEPDNNNVSVTPAISEPQDSADLTPEKPDDAAAPIPSALPTPESTPEAKKDVPVLPIGETISIDEKCEFYLDYFNVTNDVMPPKPGSWYFHYAADSGKVYVDVCVAYKNLETRDIGADAVMTGTLIYSGKYEYGGFSIIEENSRGGFTYSNITNIAPLSTEYVHYLFSVPEEVQLSENAVDVILTIAGGEYKVIIKEGATGTVASNSADSAAQKTGGEVAVGEKISTDNSEFFVDYANITNDVMPPRPGNWYTHYEADNGKVYVDLCVGYKNTSGKSVIADNVISAKLKYADRYEYTGFSVIEENSRGGFTYSNITNIAPLSTEYVHYLFSVPEEVGNSSDKIVISFSIDGNDYIYTVR